MTTTAMTTTKSRARRERVGREDPVEKYRRTGALPRCISARFLSRLTEPEARALLAMLERPSRSVHARDEEVRFRNRQTARAFVERGVFGAARDDSR